MPVQLLPLLLIQFPALAIEDLLQPEEAKIAGQCGGLQDAAVSIRFAHAACDKFAQRGRMNRMKKGIVSAFKKLQGGQESLAVLSERHLDGRGDFQDAFGLPLFVPEKNGDEGFI